MGRCIYDETLRKAVDCLNTYVDRENELIKLAGFNLRTLIDKLKAGYTIEAPKEKDWAPHLINCACSDDWAQGMTEVYLLNISYGWDDLTDDEKRKLYESQSELDQATKPPLGVMPRDIWNRKRQKELVDAMQRYLEVGKSIPREWIDEYNELSDGEET